MASVIVDSLPVIAVLIVIMSMMYVDLLIIGDALRALTVIPILVVLLLWLFATYRMRRQV